MVLVNVCAPCPNGRAPAGEAQYVELAVGIEKQAVESLEGSNADHKGNKPACARRVSEFMGGNKEYPGV